MTHTFSSGDVLIITFGPECPESEGPSQAVFGEGSEVLQLVESDLEAGMLVPACGTR